jgi:hypothetical protein
MFLGKNGILQSAKRFREVDLDSWCQNATFFFLAFESIRAVHIYRFGLITTNFQLF